MHARQQLLVDLRTLAEAAATPPWRAAYIGNDLPAQAKLPCVLIRQTGEPAQDAGLLGVRRQERVLNIAVEYVMKALADPEKTTAALNDAAAALETVITQAAVVHADDIGLAGTDIAEQPDESGFVSITLAWWLRYSTREGRPSTFGTD